MTREEGIGAAATRLSLGFRMFFVIIVFVAFAAGVCVGRDWLGFGLLTFSVCCWSIAFMRIA